MEGAHRQFHPMKRRGTPIPVAPPRIPTPMPTNNNNGPRSTTKDEDSSKNSTTMPSGQDTQHQRLISKAPFRLLDNDVKTAWINPRLISKVDLDLIKKTEYLPPYERNMNGHNPHHLRPSSCGRIHDREWETPTTATTMAVNGRAKHGPLSSVPTTTSTGTPEQSGVDRRVRSKPGISANLRAKINMPNIEAAKSGGARNMKSRLPQGASKVTRANTSLAVKNNGQVNAKNTIATLNPQALNVHAAGPFINTPTGNHQVRGLSYHQQNVVCDSAGVFGVYAETKYVYAVNSVGNNLAQASAAAAFFASKAALPNTPKLDRNIHDYVPNLVMPPGAPTQIM